MYRLKNKCPFYFLLFTFCFLLIITCTTSPQTGTLSGTVQLEAQSDNSGIVIGIYELAELDPDIVEANQKWPHIGVIINQHTEFDHRFGTLVKTGETDASGYFEINNIPTGVYNVVAIKDSFGFRYIYNVQINSGDKTIPTAKAILTLYSETLINSDISTPTTWQRDHHYLIEDDIDIYDSLTIEPGAVVRLDQGKDITSYGTFYAVGEYENFIWLTKNDGFSENLNMIEPDSNCIWDRVTLEPYSQAQVQWCKFDWANIGMLNHVNGFEISDCIFQHSNCGLMVEDADSTFCSSLIFRRIDNDNFGGFSFYSYSHGGIKNSIISTCKIGIKIYEHCNPDINNNYINSCKNIGIEISYYSDPLVNFNTISNCNYGIYVKRFSHPLIERNTITSNNCIINYDITNPILYIRYNNLSWANRSIINGWMTIFVSAENNYYFTISSEIIEQSIFDKNDVEPSQQQYYGEVDFQPFLYEAITNAGIQNL